MVGGDAIPQDNVKIVVQEWVEQVNVKLTLVATLRIAYVGNEVDLINANETTMNLGWIGGTSEMITESKKGVILHVHLASCTTTKPLCVVARTL